MRKIVVLSIACFLGLTACQKQTKQSNQTSQENHMIANNQQSTIIPYQELKNYFVLNTVDNKQVESKKITTQKEFDDYFSVARTMSEESIPTSVDFNKSFVLAIIGQPTNSETRINIISLKQRNQCLELIFDIDSSQQNTSYTMHPFTAILVDKKYDMDVKFIAE
ncbi:hypothetical protein [Myroides sp. LJL119]